MPLRAVMVRRRLDNNKRMTRVVIPVIAQKAANSIGSSAGRIG
jgi:hypothetical protein